MLCVSMLLVVPLLAAASQNRKIVGGLPVDISDYPWQGSLRSSGGSHECGCVFVGGQYVISAAHCGGSSAFSMEFGGTDRGSGVVFDVASVVLHPDYGIGAGFSPNDISVIEASVVLSGENILPGVMSNTIENPGGRGIITGWGRLCGSCPLAVDLQGAEVPIISDSQCEATWGDNYQSDNMICIQSQQSSSCTGDSGGPLSVGSTILGLASWGANGCLQTYPSVYTRVGTFQGWVCDQTEGLPQGC